MSRKISRHSRLLRENLLLLISLDASQDISGTDRFISGRVKASTGITRQLLTLFRMRAPGRSTSRQFPVRCSCKSVPDFKRQTFVPTVVKFHHIFQCAELPFSWWMLCASRPCFFATLHKDIFTVFGFFPKPHYYQSGFISPGFISPGFPAGPSSTAGSTPAPRSAPLPPKTQDRFASEALSGSRPPVRRSTFR